MTTRLTIIRPDDWHLHLRDNEVLAGTVPATAKVFGRAIIMPNLTPPVVNLAQAQAYRQRILSHVPEGHTFEPLMVLYLTDNTRPEDIADAAASGIVFGDRKSTRLNSSHVAISYAVFCLKKKTDIPCH